MSINAVKGTHDLFAAEADGYAYIQNLFRAVAKQYGYRPIETPILEHTEVFTRSTGESSDVVRKEMYTFLDKGERSLTLRPEGTAGVIRSMVEHKLYATNDLPLKVFYAGPAFRYERPQQGRYRQFIQAGVEAVGEDSPRLDAECIVLAMRFLAYLGFKNLVVKVNTLGDIDSRLAYKEALRAYFTPRIDCMCEDCKQRLLLNPMRILDCKVPEDQEIAKGAPKMKDYLSLEAGKRFYTTLSILNDLGIEYEIDDNLVRGLDYYGHIVFEVHARSATGKDYGAVLGGGHYDSMLSEFGGPSDIDHGVGFACGVERIYSLMRDNDMLEGVTEALDIYAMPLGEEVVDDLNALCENIRDLGYSVQMPFKSGKLGAMFKKAERSGAKYALILGSDELERGVVQLKNLEEKTQIEVEIEKLNECLDNLFGEGEGEECECGHDHEHEHEEGHCCHGKHHHEGHCCHDEEKE